MKGVSVFAGFAIAGLVSAASAGVVTLTDTPAGNTYTFNPRSQGGSTAGTGTGDTNATPVGLTFNVERADQGNASYYMPTVGNTAGTLSYTFTSATPGENINTLTLFTGAAIFRNAGYPGTLTGTYTPLGGSAVQFINIDGTDTSQPNIFSQTSSAPLPVNAASVTVTYTLTPTSGNTLGVQLFRSTADIGTAGDYAFSAAATFVPEPASLGLVAIGAVTLLGRRRVRTAE